MHKFCAQNDPFPQIIIFFRKPINEPCFFHSCLSTCQKSKSDINLLVKYWRLKNIEILLAESYFWTWEPGFSQACSFRRMLMNHKNFRFTQIPGKTKDMIFLKTPNTLFLGLFLTIFGHLCLMGIFSKKSGSVPSNYIWAPNTILSFRKKLMSQFWENLGTDGRTDGRTDPIL